MSTWEAILLGIVQGLTEFLPISSTAHLRIVPALVGWSDPGAEFTAIIQLGTLVAVFLYFWSDIVRIAAAVARGVTSGRPLATLEARLGWMIALGTVPIVVCGLLFKEHIKNTLRSLYVVAAALILVALVLAWAEWLLRRRAQAGHAFRELDQLTWLDSFLIGCAQAVALIPGSSRSGTTIAGGLFCGLSRSTAARFSFLLSLPSVLAAAVLEMYDVYKHRASLPASFPSMGNLVLSTVVSGIVGYAAIALLIRYLKTHTMWIFIWYRLLLGGLLLALLLTGKIAAVDDEVTSKSEVQAGTRLGS
jgi:undecaprenyl-diphosphatase